MNIPNVYKKVVEGFLIQPRTFSQMLSSAFGGVTSLLNEKSRSDFIEKLDRGVINEGVISQATTGPLILLSLFNDLQSPLFKRHKFDPNEVLEGVAPALVQFHNVSGALENEFYQIQKRYVDDVISTSAKSSVENSNEDKAGLASPSETDEKDKSDSVDRFQEEEKEHLISIIEMCKRDGAEMDEKEVAAILNHDWRDDAKKDPESLAGQLSRIVTAELLQMHQTSAKTSFVLQRKEFLFKEGSSSVNNVALLSARAISCPPERQQGQNSVDDVEGRRFESTDGDGNNIDGSDQSSNSELTGVAAQLEILYDVRQQFVPEPGDGSKIRDESATDDQTPSDEVNLITTTAVNVATIEGWLNGSVDGELRWRLALIRPAFEFPGIYQSY